LGHDKGEKKAARLMAHASRAKGVFAIRGVLGITVHQPNLTKLSRGRTRMKIERKRRQRQEIQVRKSIGHPSSLREGHKEVIVRTQKGEI